MPNALTATTPQTLARHANGRFGPGNPGRRSGSRNRVSQRVALAILDDFETNQEAVLGVLREFHIKHYIDVVTRLLPLEIEISQPDFDSYSDEEAALVVTRLRSTLDRIEAGSGSLIELAAAIDMERAPEGEPARRINGDLR